MSKKLIQAAAGAGGESVYVEDVFSTYVYTGTGATQTITNGIDLDGEGGLVWTKNRNQPRSHNLVDTERGVRLRLMSNSTDGQYNEVNGLTSFNSDGYSLSTATDYNANNDTYASWTFRKQAGFFDVVTWTGDGTSSRQISHNLGSSPGVIIVKKTNSSTDSYWMVYHRDSPENTATTPNQTKNLVLQSSAAIANNNCFGAHSTQTDSYFTLGTANLAHINGSGNTYVAYVFAHDDQSFGDNQDEAIIKCGSYTGTGTGGSPTIDLGWEPQWLLMKNLSNTSNWYMLDIMRGWAVNGDGQRLFANTTASEYPNSEYFNINPTGFTLGSTVSTQINTSGETYIYIAIRRPMKTPESGTEVFDVQQSTTTDPNFVTGFNPDMTFSVPSTTASFRYIFSRLTGTNFMETSSTNAESTGAAIKWDYSGGAHNGFTSYYGWNFKRATGFFDVVAYSGDGNNPRSITHNLSVVPEFIAIKKRSAEGNWWVWVNGLTDNATYAQNLQLSETDAEASNNVFYKSSDQSSTAFKIGAGFNGANDSGATYIAYLFATLAGVSKVGSYTGTGNSLDIDCGFSSGARFVLIKRTNSTSDWWVWDSERGIVAGNDPTLRLNSTAAETTNADYIDPLSSGFTLTTAGNWLYGMNYPSGEYIFLAIA